MTEILEWPSCKELLDEAWSAKCLDFWMRGFTYDYFLVAVYRRESVAMEMLFKFVLEMLPYPKDDKTLIRWYVFAYWVNSEEEEKRYQHRMEKYMLDRRLAQVLEVYLSTYEWDYMLTDEEYKTATEIILSDPIAAERAEWWMDLPLTDDEMADLYRNLPMEALVAIGLLD